MKPTGFSLFPLNGGYNGDEVNRKKILVVDDEKKIVSIIRAALEKQGFEVIDAYDGKAAIDVARNRNPDLIVLDLMLPEISGWEVCRTLRQESGIPIIMLTARDEITHKISGLEMGADDYVTKPFNIKELVSRIKAVLRRVSGMMEASSIIEIADLSVDMDGYEVRRHGEAIKLTPTEFKLLGALAESPGHVYTRVELADKIQGKAYEGHDKTIDSHIKNLRKKLELSPDDPEYIITVHGVGYKLEAE